MITTNRQRRGTGFNDATDVIFYRLRDLTDSGIVKLTIAIINDVFSCKRIVTPAIRRIMRLQCRLFTNGSGPESGSGSVGGGTVEWNTCDGQINVSEISGKRPTHKAWTAGKCELLYICLLYTSPSPRDKRQSRMPSSA